MVFYLEACESGSMFVKLEKDINGMFTSSLHYYNAIFLNKAPALNITLKAFNSNVVSSGCFSQASSVQCEKM